MSNFLNKREKWIYLLFGVLLFAVLISSFIYMTNYADIRIYFTTSNGVVSIVQTSQEPSTLDTNASLFNYFTNYHTEVNMEDFKWTIYNFQTDMSSFNDLIVVYALVALVGFAVLLICSNHSRKVYYKSNLIAGIVIPAGISIFTIVMIVKNIMLMGVFNTNETLFNEVYVLKNDKTSTLAEQLGYDYVSQFHPCNNLTYIIYTIIFAIVLVYALFLIYYAIFRYKSTAERRKEIIERAVNNNA